MKFKHIFLYLTLSVLSTACVPTYSLVTPGTNNIADMQVVANSGWNQAPSQISPSSRPASQTWTQDGPLLDRLIFIPAVADGEPLLNVKSQSAALPVFRKGMLPNELEELAESTFVKLFGEGNAAVSTSNLRPHKFGEHKGVMFDMNAAVTESPDYRGSIAAFIVDEHLYMMFYLAADPYYYEKHSVAAEAVMMSATLAPAQN